MGVPVAQSRQTELAPSSCRREDGRHAPDFNEIEANSTIQGELQSAHAEMLSDNDDVS